MPSKRHQDMAHARVVLDLGDQTVALGTVGHEDRCHLGLVDDLALLQRAARRLGWSIRLLHPSEELAELVELVGLSDLLLPPPGGQRPEPGGQRPEPGGQRPEPGGQRPEPNGQTRRSWPSQ